MSKEQFQTAALEQGLAFIEPWLGQRLEDTGWPGMAVAVRHQGEPIFSAGYGYADLETGEALTPDHAVQAGSQAKTFTAATVKLLEQDGALSTLQPLADFIPELADHPDQRWRAVTIETLLSNSAGIARDGHDSDYWECTRSFPTRDSLVDTLMQTDLVFDPATRMKYSNLGYAALGHIVSLASERPYRDVVTERLIKPLGLMSTRFGFDLSILMSQGYGRRDKTGKREALPRLDVGAYEPAAGLYSSTADLARFYDTLMPDSTHATPLAVSSRVDMQTPRWLVNNGYGVQYGLGMDIGEVNGRRMSGHGGGYPGYMSKSLIDPQERLVVSGAANCIDGDGLTLTLATMKALDHFLKNAGPTEYPLNHFNAQLSGLWEDKQVVVAGGKIVAINPHSWFPFDDAEILDYVDPETLRVTSANGFKAEGELVHFSPGNVRYCGRTMQRLGGAGLGLAS